MREWCVWERVRQSVRVKCDIVDCGNFLHKTVEVEWSLQWQHSCLALSWGDHLGSPGQEMHRWDLVDTQRGWWVEESQVIVAAGIYLCSPSQRRYHPENIHDYSTYTIFWYFFKCTAMMTMQYFNSMQYFKAQAKHRNPQGRMDSCSWQVCWPGRTSVKQW